MRYRRYSAFSWVEAISQGKKSTKDDERSMLDSVLVVADICFSPFLVVMMKNEAQNTCGVTAEWKIAANGLEVASRTLKAPV